MRNSLLLAHSLKFKKLIKMVLSMLFCLVVVVVVVEPRWNGAMVIDE